MEEVYSFILVMVLHVSYAQKWRNLENCQVTAKTELSSHRMNNVKTTNFRYEFEYTGFFKFFYCLLFYCFTATLYLLRLMYGKFIESTMVRYISENLVFSMSQTFLNNVKITKNCHIDTPHPRNASKLGTVVK